MIDLTLAPPASGADRDWLALRSRLWPEASDQEHLREMPGVLAKGGCVLLARGPRGEALGFIEASTRTDYVNGTQSSPVAFVEGLYVVPGARRQGVARALVAAVERWASGRQLAELASDAAIDNVESHAAHRALGFEETERVVYFRKCLGDG